MLKAHIRVPPCSNQNYRPDYDNAGNITRKRTWTFKLTAATAANDYSELGTPSYNYSYTYANSAWGDLMTKYRSGNCYYDALGNPTQLYDGRTFHFTWKGRELQTLTLGNILTTFTYNADGLRTNKTTGGTSHDYIWEGDTLLAEITDDYTHLSTNGGHIEVIICNNPNGVPYIVDETVDPINMGTYNYASNDSFLLFYYIDHFFRDMLPYYAYGNTRDDNSGFLKWALD